jgi:glycosyltransferase involved in cell wall biosynthesis
MAEIALSALVVAHNEERQLDDCLAALRFADEIVVVLDRCTDGSRSVAQRHNARLLEGAWPIEGDRRNAGLDFCRGEWILEVDADERVPQALAEEILTAIAGAPPGYFLIPFDNYVGERLVRYGWGAAFGVSAAPRLHSRGTKRWGPERVHPKLTLQGPKRRLVTPMVHYIDRNISDMIARLDRYSTARAADLRQSGDIGTLGANIRRIFSRFWKCFIARKGYKEGAWGFLIALLAGLYPLLSYLKARLEKQ